MIVDDSAGRRLARSILVDVTLYGGGSAIDDPKAIEEGRELFADRVSASLHHVFEEERRTLGGHELPSRAPSVDRGPTGVTVVDGAGVRGGAMAVVLALVVLGMAAAATFVLAR